jgi:aspartate/methionine/tyrosine aminotransferase
LDRVAALVAEEDLLATRAGKPILALTGAPKVPFPDHVRAAAHDAVEAGEVRVPSRGLAALREAIADSIYRSTGKMFRPDAEVLVTNGAMHALNVALRAQLAGGGEVLIPSPAFMFDGVLAAAGARARYIPAADSLRWAWDLEALEKAITPATRGVIVCNPENPSGYVPDDETVQRLSRIAADRGLFLIADESYARFVYEPARHTSFATVDDQARLVIVGSMSKSYAMSSWRVGFLVAGQALVSKCLPVLEWSSIRCGYVAQAVAAAAISGPQDWMERTITEYARNRDRACSIEVPGLPIPRPDGGAFLFLRTESVAVLHQQGIPAVGGDAFKVPGYARIPFGGPLQAVEDLMNGLRSSVALSGRRSHVNSRG